MKTTILIPEALRQYCRNQDCAHLAGQTVGELLDKLVLDFPGLRNHLFSEDGQGRWLVNVYLNDKVVRFLHKNQTSVGEGDVVSIVPSAARAVAGEQTSHGLGKEEIERYSRHLIMPEVGMKGQQKLKEASVLLVGMGGLGSPLAMYLAAAGVGRIGIVDFDVVDASNLQRQIIYSTDQVGQAKLVAAEERLKGINPHVVIDRHEAKLTAENALGIFDGYDIVADGTDNFPTRYLVNDACVLMGKPNVYGSIFRFEGQVSVFFAKEGPCYRCLYPEPPPPGMVPSCAEGGVLGILPGSIGLMQATETVKLIIGKGEPLIGRLLLYDALAMKYRELKLRKDRDCPVCGQNPTVTALVDYDQFCGIGSEEKVSLAPELEIAAAELDSELTGNGEIFVLDVREAHEYDICRIPNSTLIPLNELPSRLQELDSGRDIVVHCRSGVRSAKAVKLLREAGFERVRNLVGGILAWSDDVDPSVPKY